MPRVHGSSLFTRGETQAIVTTTLATADDEQRTESLDGMLRSRFMLHYNFPPFSVGEVGRIGTGRREIGHGKLAWRAVNAALPSQEDFHIQSELFQKLQVKWFIFNGNCLRYINVINACWCSN